MTATMTARPKTRAQLTCCAKCFHAKTERDNQGLILWHCAAYHGQHNGDGSMRVPKGGRVYRKGTETLHWSLTRRFRCSDFESMDE